jgi:hypothetical protein
MPTEVKEEIKNCIQVLFFKVSLKDKDLLSALQNKEYNIRKYTLVRLRFKLGLRRRIRGVEQQQHANKLIQRLVT